MKASELARYIDHTALKTETDRLTVDKICREAKEYGFASVCVNPFWVPYVAEQLKGSGVKVCTVVGFPLGATLPEVKAFEAKEAVRLGAQEVDMVINVGAIKSGDWDLVRRDIEAVVKAVRPEALVKVILETGLLTEEEKVKASLASKEAGANFVKTSTGFFAGGATREDVALMRKTVGPEMGVKASGGIRDYKTAVEMIQAGASRIGTSSGVAIVTGAEAGDTGY